MNEELNALFEIKDNTTEYLPLQNLAKHIGIRLCVLVVALIGLIGIPLMLDSMDGLVFIYIGIFFPIAWFVFLIIETIVLHSNKKNQLRNANFIMLLVLLPIYLTALNGIA